MEKDHPSRDSKWWIVSTVLGGAVILSQTLGFAFYYDHGVLQYVAWAWLDGQWPYSGVWDTSVPPGVVLLHMLVLALGGASALAFRVLDFAVQIGTLVLLFWGARKISGPLAGMLAALLYAIAYLYGGAYNTAQRDGFIVPFLLMALYFLWRYFEKWELWSISAAGLSLGIACLIRPTYVILVGCVFFWILIARWQKPHTLSARVVPVACFAFLAAVPVGGFLLAYLFRGELGAIYEISEHLRLVYVHLERVSRIRVLLYPLKLAPVVISIGMAFSWFSDAPRNAKLRYWSVTGLVVVCMLIRLLEAKGYSYQFWPIIASMALLAGVGWDFALKCANRGVSAVSLRKISSPVLGFIVLASSVISNRSVLTGYLELKTNIRKAMVKPIPFESLVSNNRVQAAIAGFIHDNSTPDDVVQLWGAEPGILYAARRFSATRFIYTAPFRCRHRDFFEDCDGERPPFQVRWKQEFLADLTRNRPKFIVARYDREAGSLASSSAPDFPELRQLIDNQYYEEASFGVWSVFCRRSP